jgi:antitoxin component YwqK of YwqJK toxin-antitoxin module
MKNLFCTALLITLIFLCGCSNENVELSPEEQRAKDSISKVIQKQKVDSLKKKNPLLILPPDSTYTGDYTDKYPDGIVKFKGFYRFGQKHGQWMSFYPNGLLWSELHYDKGLRHGPNMTYYIDGIPRYTGFYKNDKKDSIWCYFDSTGKIVEKILFKDERFVKNLPLK